MARSSRYAPGGTVFQGLNRSVGRRALFDKPVPILVPVSEKFALRDHVLLLQAQSGVGLDIALAGLPYEEQVVARSESV